MGYILKVLEMEDELNGLRVDDGLEKYIDNGERMEELERFSEKVADSDLRCGDKCNLLSVAEEYKNNLVQNDNNPTYNLISFLLGVLSTGAGVGLKKAYKIYEKRVMDEIIDEIYRELSVVDNHGEKYNIASE